MVPTMDAVLTIIDQRVEESPIAPVGFWREFLLEGFSAPGYPLESFPNFDSLLFPFLAEGAFPFGCCL